MFQKVKLSKLQQKFTSAFNDSDETTVEIITTVESFTNHGVCTTFLLRVQTKNLA